MSHLEYDWQSPVWRHFVEDLGTISSTVRYDERGFGLSDWDVEDFSFESRVADLEAVVDDVGLQRFALLGMAQGGPVSIAYAHRHPERVSRLILHGTYAARMPNPTQEERELTEAFLQLIQVGWARPESEFRRVFTSIMIPGASEEQMTWLDALQRMCTSTRNAVASHRERQGVDVSALLDELDLPTLVLHARGDRMVAFADGRDLACRIPNARLVALDSPHHILLGDEPAWRLSCTRSPRSCAPMRRSPCCAQRRKRSLR